MTWAQLLAYVTGTVGQELLLRNEYLAAENRILKAQIKGRLSFRARGPHKFMKVSSVTGLFSASGPRLSTLSY